MAIGAMLPKPGLETAVAQIVEFCQAGGSQLSVVAGALGSLAPRRAGGVHQDKGAQELPHEDRCVVPRVDRHGPTAWACVVDVPGAVRVANVDD